MAHMSDILCCYHKVFLGDLSPAVHEMTCSSREYCYSVCETGQLLVITKTQRCHPLTCADSTGLPPEES